MIHWATFYAILLRQPQKCLVFTFNLLFKNLASDPNSPQKITVALADQETCLNNSAQEHCPTTTALCIMIFSLYKQGRCLFVLYVYFPNQISTPFHISEPPAPFHHRLLVSHLFPVYPGYLYPTCSFKKVSNWVFSGNFIIFNYNFFLFYVFDCQESSSFNMNMLLCKFPGQMKTHNFSKCFLLIAR